VTDNATDEHEQQHAGLEFQTVVEEVGVDCEDQKLAECKERDGQYFPVQLAHWFGIFYFLFLVVVVTWLTNFCSVDSSVLIQ
jgi:hypothetical protein